MPAVSKYSRTVKSAIFNDKMREKREICRANGSATSQKALLENDKGRDFHATPLVNDFQSFSD